MNPFFIVALMSCLYFAACASTSQKQVLATSTSQVQLRSFQTRAFDTTNQPDTLRTVMATMQDLGFVLRDANATLGTVTGTKFLPKQSSTVRLTVTVRPRGTTQMLVRANAQYKLKAIEEPQPYQDFFVSLEKALFLTAHNVD